MKKLPRKNLSITFFVVSLLLLSSCSPKSEVKAPNNTIQDNPSPKLIEFTETERTIVNNVYLNGENLKDFRESELRTKIKNYASSIDKPASDATLDGTTWKVKQGKVGKKVTIEKTLEILLNAQEGDKVSLVIEDVQPAVTPQKLQENLVVVGDCTTPLLDSSPSRVNNIKIAVQKIDYFILPPGKEFSFNRTLGRRTKAKGYEDAPVIIKTKDGPEKGLGVGGGICQVSTTLFNAIEECKLEILERHIHSKKVGYVPKGEDATVNYGSADLRFKNTGNYPIMFRAQLGKKSLTIKVIENRNE